MRALLGLLVIAAFASGYVAGMEPQWLKVRAEIRECSKSLDAQVRLNADCVATLEQCSDIVHESINRLTTCEGNR